MKLFLSILFFSTVALVGAFADFIGIGNPNTFGISQYVCILFGLVGGYLSFLYFHRKMNYAEILVAIRALYTTISINLLNLAILIALVELSFTLALKYYLTSQNPASLRDQLASPAYSKYDWFDDFKKEHSSSQNFHYKPYFIWERLETKGRTVNIGAEGKRLTVNSNCRGRKKILLFGGSTMWGVGAPDWNTIPSELQKLLDDHGIKKYCIENFGENAFVSTQNLLRLQRLLQLNYRPDIVIFYNGYNEIAAGFQTRRAGLHQNLSEIEEKLNSGSNIRKRKEITGLQVIQYLMPNTYSYLFIYGRESSYGEIKFTDRLPTEIADSMFKDFQMVEALAQKFNFKAYYFLQPTLFHKEKWTDFEQEVSKEVTDNFVALLKNTYNIFSQKYQRNEAGLKTYDISDIFQEESGETFIDKVHLTPEKNKKIAQKMFSSLAL